MSKRKILPIIQNCKCNGIILWDTEVVCERCIQRARRLLDKCEADNKESANQFNDKFCVDCKFGPLEKSFIIANTCDHCSVRYTYRCKNCTIASFTKKIQSLCSSCKDKDWMNRHICYNCCTTVPEDEFIVCENCDHITRLCTYCKTKTKESNWPCEYCEEENSKQIIASGTNWKSDDKEDNAAAAAVDTVV